MVRFQFLKFVASLLKFLSRNPKAASDGRKAHCLRETRVRIDLETAAFIPSSKIVAHSVDCIILARPVAEILSCKLALEYTDLHGRLRSRKKKIIMQMSRAFDGNSESTPPLHGLSRKNVAPPFAPGRRGMERGRAPTAVQRKTLRQCWSSSSSSTAVAYLPDEQTRGYKLFISSQDRDMSFTSRYRDRCCPGATPPSVVITKHSQCPRRRSLPPFLRGATGG